MTWEQRAAEAVELATRLGQPEVDARLLELLLGVKNTAVSQAAADPLLARRDVAGLGLYVEAFGLAEEDTRNKLGDCLYDEDGTTWAFVRRLPPTLLADARPVVRQGAAAVDEHMAEEERHHGR